MRDKIRSEVLNIYALDSAEERAKAEVIEWINSGADLFRMQKPATPPIHLVSYFVLVDDDYVLLVDHINAELWLPTGGHVDVNEHPRDAASREAYEELGIDAEFLNESPQFITVTRTVGKTAGHTDVSLWYVLKGSIDQNYQYDASEFKSIRWFHKDEVPFERSDPEMKRFIQKLYAQ